MPDQPKLAGGARPRAALAPPGRVRVLLDPADGGEVLSLWATLSADRGTVTLEVDAPGVAAGWLASGRGFAGEVTAVNGRTLTVEVSP
jgi:hypothetical protein